MSTTGLAWKSVERSGSGAWFTRIRLRLGWSQSRMAETMDVATKTVRSWETGRAWPRRSDIIECYLALEKGLT